jgi:hypothetical protein
MKKVLFALICMAVPLTTLAGTKTESLSVTLRNGATADRQRTNEVWKALVSIDHKVYVRNDDIERLLFASRACKGANGSVLCNLRDNNWLHFHETQIQKFDTLKITYNGILDNETQNIIVSSYQGTKIIERHHPVAKWYESIPGYGIIKLCFNID